MNSIAGIRCLPEARRRFLSFALLVFCAMAAAPAAFGADAPPAELKRVGVISIAGDLLYDDRVGMMVFGNKLSRHDVADWGLDDAWEDKIEAALPAVTTAEIVPLSVDRALLRVAYPSAEDEESIIAQYRMPKFKRITEALQTIAAENSLDAIVLLASDSIELAGTNQSLESFGVFSSGKKGPA